MLEHPPFAAILIQDCERDLKRFANSFSSFLHHASCHEGNEGYEGDEGGNTSPGQEGDESHEGHHF